MRINRIGIVLIILALAALACNAPGGAGDAPTQSTPVVIATTGTTSAASVTPPSGPTTTLAATPTQGSAGQATTAPSGPQRISFAAGATSATVNGAFTSTNSAPEYLINVQAGQTMTVTLNVPGGGGALAVNAPDGTLMLPGSMGAIEFSEVLPQTGDYKITVIWITNNPTNFTLTVTIPPLSAGGSCTVTAPDGTTAYSESSVNANVFGQMSGDDPRPAGVRTKDGWIGFDPGVAQAGNVGRARNRWVNKNTAALTFNPAGCENALPLVLSLAQLENGTYAFEGSSVTLSDGEYTNPDFDPATTGDAIAYSAMGTVYAFGDLNGDSKEDAIITVSINTGGTGTFVHFFAVINNNGDPAPSEGLFLDDRGWPEAMSIDAGLVTAEVLIHGPSDPGCCPATNETWVLKLVGNALVKQ